MIAEAWDWRSGRLRRNKALNNAVNRPPDPPEKDVPPWDRHDHGIFKGVVIFLADNPNPDDAAGAREPSREALHRAAHADRPRCRAARADATAPDEAMCRHWQPGRVSRYRSPRQAPVQKSHREKLRQKYLLLYSAQECINV
jgi:hypothetical protein